MDPDALIAVSRATEEAQRILRNPDQFQWATVTLLAFVMYVYSVEIERRRWDIVLAGLAFWLMDGVVRGYHGARSGSHHPGRTPRPASTPSKR